MADVTPAKIPNHLVQSILVTVLCCLPLGIVGIVFSMQVDSKLAAGDIAGAQDASKKAELFNRIGFWITGVIAIIYAALMLIGLNARG